ncbi:DUF1433 domain-containing protein [Streptococcus plurextorum]|uniref:DUF1433 domain-containing protein n=1 Tax=Streptococcus plurextorum TaxID=456876 RepID=UPI0003F9CCC8|nr:DUF1433 domain-containing protein [Streptococcus plurextorum]
MKKRRSFISLVVAITILILGGCGMTESDKEVKYREEQDRMVEYLAQNYEDIKKVEFTEIEHNKITGTYSFYATINNQIQIDFTLRGLNGEIYVNELSSRNHGHFLKKSDTPNEKPDVAHIEVKYLEE